MNNKLFILKAIAFVIGFTSCNPNQTETTDLTKLPVITTTAISAITDTTANCGGSITSDAGSTVTSRGVCWSTSPNPTIADKKTVNGAGIGTFTSVITGLIPSTSYYVRAYATNANGTVYGSSYQITTISLVTVTTTAVNSVSYNSVTAGGTVNATDNIYPITSRGVCWSTTPNPNIADSKTVDGAGIGAFTSVITGLISGTSYYVRAYAANANGTVYGNSRQFTTVQLPQFNPNLIYGTMTDIDGNIYKTITIGSQTWMAENLKTTKYRNGDNVAIVTDNATWLNLTTGACCNYNNDATTSVKYGKLYNWYAVADTRNIAPVGWHVATSAEWTTLTNYASAHLGTSVSVGKTLASATDWQSDGYTGNIGCNLSLNNSSGFSALPAGWRSEYSDYDLGHMGIWWSATNFSTNFAEFMFLFSDNGGIDGPSRSKYYGFSVRCVRD